MNHRAHLLVFGSFLLLRSLHGTALADAPAPAESPRLPFSFVENTGQFQSGIRYIGNGPDFNAWFEDDGVIFRQDAAALTMKFVDGRPNPRIDASDRTGAIANYFLGADPDHWRAGLPLSRTLTYNGVWPGIAIRFRADGARPTAEYVVSPGASLASIRLRFDGKTSIAPDGSLVVSGEYGQLSEEKPFLFQGAGLGKTEVPGTFVRYDDGTIGFTAAPYDPQRPLTVDPNILFSGYFGGNAQSAIMALAGDSYYDTLVAGWTIAANLPASAGAQKIDRGGVDAFVASFSPAGGALIFCTYLGGSGDDRAFGLAVDAAGNVYVTGWSSSANFPVYNPVQPKLSGTRDAFVTKLNASGNALVYSTYLGGSGVESGNAIALDSSESAVIVGDTTSTNLATTAGAVQPHLGGIQDAFVAKLSPSGNAITFLTYFGGLAVDHGAAVKLDSSNAIYMGGSTSSPNFPTVNAAQPQSGGGQDGFVAKLSPSGTSILFSTFLGGSGGTPGAPEEVNALDVTSSSLLFVGGTTSSLNFPVTATAFQPNFGGGMTDGFFARYSSTTGALQRCTYIGGSGDDGINGMATDYLGTNYVVGYTTSTDFPVVNPIQSAIAGGMNAFVAKILPAQILFATYLGGSGIDAGNAITIDSMTSIVVAGSSSSLNFPVAGHVGAWAGSPVSSFVTKLAPDFTLNVVASGAFYEDTWHDTGYDGPNVNLTIASFGVAGDIPVIGDWDGSGVKRIGVFRNGEWLLDINGDGVFDAGDKTVLFGQAGDVPVVGDWNGTGRIKLGLFRQGSFILDLSGHLSGIATGLSDAQFPFGLASDIPVVADWSSTGTTKVGVFRAGLWLVDYNGDHVFNGLDKTYSYGQAGDIPVVGQWTSNGVPYIGVYRDGLWILNYDGSNSFASGGISELYLAFGGSGYIPLVK